MNDTVAYILIIVPTLLLLGKLAYDCDCSFKEWAMQFLYLLIIGIAVVSICCGLLHFCKDDKSKNPPAVESPK